MFQAVSGMMIMVAIVNGDLYFNNAKVLLSNVIVNNGVVHVLDQVRPGISPCP